MKVRQELDYITMIDWVCDSCGKNFSFPYVSPDQEVKCECGEVIDNNFIADYLFDLKESEAEERYYNELYYDR